MATRKNKNWTLPLFVGLRVAQKIGGSKMEGIMQGRHIWTSSRLNNWEWMHELISRFIRRNRVLVGMLPDLCLTIQNRYPATSSTLDDHINANAMRDIGILFVNELGEIVASNEHLISDDLVCNAARYRDKKLREHRSKKLSRQLHAEALEAQILAWELEFITKHKKRFDKLAEYEGRRIQFKIEKEKYYEQCRINREAQLSDSHIRRSAAAKQSWLRRQQNGSPAEHGGNDRAVGSDNVPCVEQHA